MRICSFDGCQEKHHGKGLCRKHYNQMFPRTPESRRASRERTKEHIAAHQKLYKKTNCGKLSAAKYRSKKETKEKAALYQKEYRSSEVFVIKKRAYNQKRRCATLGVENELVVSGDIFERDCWVCKICGEEIDKNKKYPDMFSVSLDHKIPISKGGGHTKDNCQASHLMCNIRKGDKTMEEFIIWEKSLKI